MILEALKDLFRDFYWRFLVTLTMILYFIRLKKIYYDDLGLESRSNRSGVDVCGRG